MGPIICSECLSTVDLSETFFQESTAQPEPLYARCLKFVCGDCVQWSRMGNNPITCGHIPACPIAPVSLSSRSLEESPDNLFPPAEVSSLALPSKVKALVADLRSLPSDVKWYVSCFVPSSITQKGNLFKASSFQPGDEL
jgi:hypothetical protein